MTISILDIKILWARAGGRCSAPDCLEDLTVKLEASNYIVGEMAHVIGNKPTAARGIPSGGSDSYDNLILLCPTHHTHIDKAPEGTYTVDCLLKWKKDHEEKISNIDKTIKFGSFELLRNAIRQLLIKNKIVFDTYGPYSPIAKEDPSSNAYKLWEFNRINTILPNNKNILNMLDNNNELIDPSLIEYIEKFRMHANSYEQHVYYSLDSYQLFPKDFAEVFQ